MHSRKELTKIVARRYFGANKKDKSVILDEFCSNCSYERKYAIKLLKRTFIYPKETKQKRNKPSRYVPIKPIMKTLWEVADYPSGTRLHAVLPVLVERGIAFGEIKPNLAQQRLLSKISIATIDRMLQSELRTKRRKINGQTKGGKLKYEIPFAVDCNQIISPGTLEIDLVVHCGESAMGEFINTLNSTDIVTSWYEAEAIMGKSQRAVDAALEQIAKRLPFPLMGIDSDNGTEFINWNLKRWAQRRRITFTRSRPYKKNDNAHIEQKNFTHVRKIIGYMRLDTKQQQAMLNDLYRNELRLYINFFQPSQKLIKKVRIGSKIKRVYDVAKTPLQRLLESDDVPDEVKRKLKAQYKQLNPFALKRAIDRKLKLIMDTLRTQS